MKCLLNVKAFMKAVAPLIPLAKRDSADNKIGITAKKDALELSVYGDDIYLHQRITNKTQYDLGYRCNEPGQMTVHAESLWLMFAPCMKFSHEAVLQDNGDDSFALIPVGSPAYYRAC